MEQQRKTYDARLEEIRASRAEQVEESDEQRVARLERQLNSLAVYSAMVWAS